MVSALTRGHLGPARPSGRLRQPMGLVVGVDRMAISGCCSRASSRGWLLQPLKVEMVLAGPTDAGSAVLRHGPLGLHPICPPGHNGACPFGFVGRGLPRKFRASAAWLGTRNRRRL